MVLTARRPSSELGGGSAVDAAAAVVVVELARSDAMLVVDKVGTALELFDET